MGDISKHKRVNDILLGPLEHDLPCSGWLPMHSLGNTGRNDGHWNRRCLDNHPGVRIEVISIPSVPMAGVARICLINWVGDSLDGTLARYRHIERPKYGFFIDHVTDVLTEIIIVLGLGLSPYVSFSVASLFCISYITMSVLVYVRMNVTGEFKISYSKLGPTEIRVLAILLNTVMFFVGTSDRFSLGSLTFAISAYDLVVSAISLLLIYFFAETSIKQSIALRELGE